MSVVKCKFCAEEIQETAIICKHCGKSQKDSKMNKWIYVAIAAAGFTLVIFFAGVKSGEQNQESVPSETSQADSENKDLSVFLDFNDEGLTDVISLEFYFSAEQEFPGQTTYFTCSQAATDNLYKTFGDPMETNMLAMGTIQNLGKFKANLLKSDSSLLAISSDVYPVMSGGNTCSWVFTFEDVKFDGLPFVFDLSEYGVEKMPISPNDIVNGEVRIRLNKLKMKSILD
jgi:hypothetical protein